MNSEFAAMLDQQGFVPEWARKVTYGIELSTEEKEMNSAADAMWKEIGKTGDKDHELSALLIRSLQPELIMAPGELLGRMFNEGNVGEFDDYRVEALPTNTLQAYESIVGGNVDRSFIDHSLYTPTTKFLAIETDVAWQELRRGGYKNVANLVNFAMEAFEQKRVYLVMTAIAAAITQGSANYITEATTMPTDTSMQSLSLYLADVADGIAPFAFGLNKYIQAIGNLTYATANKTDDEKKMWYNDGFLKMYSGIELMGFSGQKTFADGSYLVPNYTLIGCSGKIGNLDMKGETRVYQSDDINTEKTHLKLTGYSFSYAITDSTKVAKMVISST